MDNTFQITSLSQLSPNAIQIVFSSTPVVQNASFQNDALNISNYTLTGAGSSQILVITPHLGNPNAIDILFNSTLNAGLWVVTIKNGSVGIRDTHGNYLTGPNTIEFDAQSNTFE